MRTLAKALLITQVTLALTVGATARADEVEDAVKEALEYYASGDYSSAAGSLDYAAQLVRQKKGGELEAFLPDALDGWTAEAASSEGAGAALLGGAVTARRSYVRDGDRVDIQIVTDSPLLQGMMMMLTNPSFATADGGKLERIGGQKAIVKHDATNRQGDVRIVVANRFLVTVEGMGVERSELVGFAEAVDYKALSAQP